MRGPRDGRGATRNNGYPSGEDEEVGEEITGGHSHLVGHQSHVPAELLWLCWEHVFTEEWGPIGLRGACTIAQCLNLNNESLGI